jgi:hypothetical protein
MKRSILSAAMSAALLACTPMNMRPPPSTTGGAGPGGGSTGGNAGTGGSTGGSGGVVAAPPDSGAGGKVDGPAASPDGGSKADGGSAGTGVLFNDPLAPLPKSLADTGFFPNFPDTSKVADQLKFYVPDPPLYSDGLKKQRYILLPKGQKIDVSDRKNWVFPVGTIFVKVFLDDKKPVETRIVRHVTDAFEPFEFASYKWNADGTAAELAEITGDTHVPTPATVGGVSFQHTIPSQNDCAGCHKTAHMKDSQTTSGFIGFDEIRLNNKAADPNAPKTQLQTFADLGYFNAALPTPAADVRDPMNMQREKVRRFIFGNCVHCHNPGNIGQTDFSPEMFVANVRNKPPGSHVMPPAQYKLVVPMKPMLSILYLQAAGPMEIAAIDAMSKGSQTNLHPMPPVGVEHREFAEFKTELDNLAAWITAGAN